MKRLSTLDLRPSTLPSHLRPGEELGDAGAGGDGFPAEDVSGLGGIADEAVAVDAAEELGIDAE